MPTIVLASTSPYRRELLSRLQIPFTVSSPNVDELAISGEVPAITAERLAVAKATAVAPRHENSLIIGSDQVAYSRGQVYGKPGTIENACLQLRAMSGQEIIFHTGICLYNTATGNTQVAGVPIHVGFRELNDDEIYRYLAKEDALSCAGSAKSEGLGISLLRYIRGDDSTALVGLPLIALCSMLRNEGVVLP